MARERTAYVTGGTGFVGSHLIERLVKEGYEVRVLVLESEDPSWLESLGVECVRGDMTDPPEKLREGIAGATHFFHCAAWVAEWAPRHKMVNINVKGLGNLLEGLRAVKLKRFVYVGSIVVYGDRDQVNLSESARFVRTGDSYNYTKIECERLLWHFARQTGLPVAILRPPYIYGERDNKFFPRCFKELLHHKWIYLNGGRIPFALVDVHNVVEACILAAEREEAIDEGFIITDGESMTRRELVELICDEMGYDRPWISFPRGFAKTMCPVADAMATFCGWDTTFMINWFLYHFAGVQLTYDISKARRLLGYEPKSPMRESLRRTIRWFKENHPEYLPKR